MAEKKIYIGSIGPLLYDDSDPIDDADGDFTGVDQQGFATDGSVYVGGDQTIAGDVVITGELEVGDDLTLVKNLIIADGQWIGQAAGPLMIFDDSNNYLEISGCNVGINSSAPDSALRIVQESDAKAISISSAATTQVTMLVLGKYGLSFQQNANGGYAAQYYRDRAEAGSYALMQVKDDNAATTQPALEVIQDGTAADGVKITSAYVGLRIQSKYGFIAQQTVSGGYAGQFWRNQDEAGSNPLVELIDDHTANTQPTLKIRQDGTGDILTLYDDTNQKVRFIDGGYVILASIKSGATQGGAGAAAGELWKTASHITLPDDVVMIGV